MRITNPKIYQSGWLTAAIALRSAPWLSSNCTILRTVSPGWRVRNEVAAMCNGVASSYWAMSFQKLPGFKRTLAAEFTSALLSTRYSITDIWPYHTANIKGVHLDWPMQRSIHVWFYINAMTSLTLSFASISAPFSNRYLTTGKRPDLAACNNGVVRVWYICIYVHVWHMSMGGFSLQPHSLPPY